MGVSVSVFDFFFCPDAGDYTHSLLSKRRSKKDEPFEFETVLVPTKTTHSNRIHINSRRKSMKSQYETFHKVNEPHINQHLFFFIHTIFSFNSDLVLLIEKIDSPDGTKQEKYVSANTIYVVWWDEYHFHLPTNGSIQSDLITSID